MDGTPARSVGTLGAPGMPLSASSETDFQRLLRGLAFAREFALFIVQCEADDLRRGLTGRLRAALGAQGRRVFDVDLSLDCNPIELLDEHRGDGVVLSAFGLERREGGQDALVHALRTMNLQREQYPKRVGCPLILWLSTEALALLPRHAPDFYDWRSGMYVMVPGPGLARPDYEMDLRTTYMLDDYGVIPDEAKRRIEPLLDLVQELREARPTAQNREALSDTVTRAIPLLIRLGRHTEAIALATQARDLAVAAGDRRCAARAAKLLADLKSASGDRREALRLLREEALPHHERLAAEEPTNAGRQRDLAVSHDRVGDVQRAQGDLVGALSSYRACLAISERLAEQDPSHAEWQRYLSVSYNKVGDVQRAHGDLVGALGSYRAGLAISERLAEQDPSNAEWQRDLAISYRSIGRCAEGSGDQAEAERWFRRARDVLRGMRDRGVLLDPATAEWLSRLESEYPD